MIATEYITPVITYQGGLRWVHRWVATCRLSGDDAQDLIRLWLGALTFSLPQVPRLSA